MSDDWNDLRRAALKKIAAKKAVEPASTLTPGLEYGSDLLAYLGDDDPGDDADAWLIPGIVAAGVPQMIAGHPKSKKTFLAEHQAICIAAGIDWLGRKTQRGRVLILPREDSVRETRRRIWRLARGLGLDPRLLDGWLRIDTLTPFYWTDVDAVGRLLTTIDSWHPSLIVMDSLSRTHMGDENSASEMLPVTNTWSDICQQTGVTISIIHHFVKNGKGSLLQQLRGTGNLGATLRHLIGVEKPEDHNAPFELSFDGNLQGLPPPFRIQMLDGRNETGHAVIRFQLAKETLTSLVHEDPLRDPLIGELASKLLGAVEMTVSKLRQGLGAVERVRDALEVMKEHKLIKPVLRGRKHCGYQITESGRKFATGEVDIKQPPIRSGSLLARS